MYSLTKLVHATRNVLSSRLASASLHITPSANITTKSQEEKFGLPPRPRKPLTPFFRFLAETRPKVTKENPKLSTMEVVKVCSKQWAEFDEGKKQKLNVDYKKDQESYVDQRAKYESLLTDEQRDLIHNLKEEADRSKEKRAYKKKVRANDKPKKPASGFLRFLKEEYANTDRSKFTYREFQQEIVKKWNSLTDAKKKTYNDQFTSDLVKYRQELARWELKMIRLGNVELVRQEALVEQPAKRKAPATAKVGARKPKGSDSD